mmetsp:Transcript_28038/g.68107  ORF Transcript_28038/g.68107 Transcript_28038/m.68107 type:complete len:136 (-) Transcript_28038:2204-2611(-)
MTRLRPPSAPLWWITCGWTMFSSSVERDRHERTNSGDSSNGTANHKRLGTYAAFSNRSTDHVGLESKGTASCTGCVLGTDCFQAFELPTAAARADPVPFHELWLLIVLILQKCMHSVLYVDVVAKNTRLLLCWTQ